MGKYTAIDKPEDFFNTVTYTGDGSADQSMTGVGFKPDFLWIKRRNASERHVLTNVQMGASSGAYKWLDSSDVSAEFSGGTGVASFDSDGFTIKTSDSTWNTNSSTYVFWSWKLNGGTTATNSDGSTDTTVQANTTSGVSVVTFTTDGGNETYGHGLGVKPDIVLVKSVSGAGSWLFTTDVFDGSVDYLVMNSEGYKSDLSYGAFTSSTFQYNDNNAVTQIAYCFASKQGFSKYGTYVGNANTNGPFIYTGFKPAWILIKANSNYKYWNIYDNKRDTYNSATKRLAPSLQAGEDTQDGIDFLSNGFKIRNSGTTLNESGTTILYMAFAENPFTTSTGIPTTAR
jgi:hypothetical protein